MPFRGPYTLAELSAKHRVYPNMISQWKRKTKEGLPDIFSKKNGQDEASRDAEVKELHANIGQLAI